MISKCTSSFVLPGTGTGADSRRKIHVSISFASARMDACKLRASGIGVVSKAQIQSLATQSVKQSDRQRQARHEAVSCTGIRAEA